MATQQDAPVLQITLAMFALDVIDLEKPAHQLEGPPLVRFQKG